MWTRNSLDFLKAASHPSPLSQLALNRKSGWGMAGFWDQVLLFPVLLQAPFPLLVSHIPLSSRGEPEGSPLVTAWRCPVLGTAV